MSNTYYDATGLLTLKTATPVIHAVFSHLKVDVNRPDLEPGTAYIADIAEDTSSDWESIVESILIDFSGKPGFDKAQDEDVPTVLTMVARHFKADMAAFKADCIDGVDFEEEATYEQLFKLARYFDDGHGLTKLMMQGCWHSDKSHLDGFGGNCILVTEHGTFRTGSSSAMDRFKALDDLLQTNQLEQAGKAFLDDIQRQLDQITNSAQRGLLGSIVKHKIAGMATL